MRRAALVLLMVAVVGAGSALAHGPSGSYEGSRDHRIRNNNVTCAKGVRVSRVGTTAYAASNGVEVCKSGGVGPQGRLIVSRSGYVAADGDRNNPGRAKGYLRIDRSGPHCSHGSDLDAPHSRTAGNPRTCAS